MSDPRLVVDRECEVAGGGTEANELPEAADPEAAITETTVDELLDRLNSPAMGGTRVGDLFRFEGELMGSEYWTTGVSGDYIVDFSAYGGDNDLQVLVDEADAAGWTDGTRLEVVVEHVEVMIDGELLDGFLRLVSSKPAP